MNNTERPHKGLSVASDISSLSEVIIPVFEIKFPRLPRLVEETQTRRVKPASQAGTKRVSN